MKRGRPPKQKVETVNYSLDQIVELIYRLVRAAQGLSPEDQQTIFRLMDIKDIRETTRIDRPTLDEHSFEMLLSEYGGEEWQIFERIADMEDHYQKSLDGKNWEAAILMEKAKTPEVPSNQIVVPQIVSQTEEKKKRFWQRNKEKTE